ncbi:T9SS sorting signal type C domain-containing protein [Xanthomarina sp. F2636L]|uniref:T9SS sorting signal type C domain-containing protein n=1 Tax=Xanthomarina sp. F2636L TaxID=2996018 RepID=UPI00225E6AE4|nr:T9SS sorting signal type C domain-containing protein [Xanthomarina sp. F2636L]MCX7550427.1 T9SS sorting signal type C domain-containing protein [Xanthomarina sp. F2636L]
MKLIITLIFFATCSLLFAQTDLYVSNNANIYVYVDGTAFSSGTNAPLYVTNGIELAGTNSNLYLRNEAHLLQGNDVGNSGTGRLSVHQTGNSNTYMYNYWGSPVGQNNGVAGNTTFMPSNNFYRETAAPITSTPFGFIAGYNGTTSLIASYWLYTYIGLPSTTNPYEDWIGLGGGSLPVGGDPNGTLDSGYGFTMKGNPSGAQKYDFRGRPNNGTITATVNINRETLVGNPYPSALDARDFIHDPLNTGILADYSLAFTTGVLKYWEQDALSSTSHVLSSYIGGYALYTISAGGVDSFTHAPFTTYLLDGTPTNFPTGTGSKIAYRYIPVGQGFFIEGAATGVVTFTNNQREFYKQSGTNSEFFRTVDSSGTEDTIEETEYTEDGLNIVPADFKRFRINVDFSQGEFYTRQLLMNFHHTATDGFDYGLEAKTKFSENSDAYWILDNVPYLIQAFNYDMELRIPLVVEAKNNQPIRFRIFDVQNFDESQPVFIHDIEAGLYVDLRQQDYEINLPQGNYTDRFEITFTSEALNIDQVITAEDINMYQNNHLAVLTISNPKLLEIKQVRLYDVSGKQIFDERNLNKEATYSFSTKNLSQGVYIANVTFADNQVISKKIIVSNK